MSEDLISQLVKQIARLQNQVDGLIKPEVGLLTQPEILAAPYSLINGGFLVWQRGTSFAAIAHDTISADRWHYLKSGAMVHTITRDTSVPTATEAEVLLPYSVKLDVTTIDGAIGASDYCTFGQRIEGYNFLPLAQREFVISFWVRDTVTGVHCISFRNSGFDRSYVAEYTINAADTWEYKSIIVSPSPSAGTWDYTTGVGLLVDFCLAAGTTLQTTADAWQTGNYVATSSQVNAVDNVANNFYLAGVMLTPGAIPADIFIPDYGSELVRCQRYYETQGGVTQVIWVYGIAGGAGEVYAQGSTWITEKRVAPTLTIEGTWNLLNVGAGPTVVATSTNRWEISVTTGAAGAFHYYPNSADDLIVGDAEF